MHELRQHQWLQLDATNTDGIHTDILGRNPHFLMTFQRGPKTGPLF